MKLLILHLSDIHFTVEKNYDKNKVSAIVATLNSYAKGIEHVLFVVSGDLAFSGTKQETRIVVRFFQDLRVAVINRYNIQDISFAVVPGNHDVNYNLGDDGRDGLEEIEKDDLYDQEIPKELKKQEQFYDSFKRFGCFRNKNLLHQKTMSYGDIKIQINLINTAVFSSLSNDQGFHYLPQKDINRLSNRNDADFVFSVMHHPHHWYTSRCKKELEEALYSGSDLIFVGHEHFESDMTIKKDSSTVNIFAAGELCNKGCWGNSEFHIALLDMETRDYSSHKYRLNEKCGIYEEIGETRNLILTGDRFNSSGFTVTDGFYNAHFNVDKHYISKSFMDYFVFPLLEEIPNDKQNNSVTRDIKTTGVETKQVFGISFQQDRNDCVIDSGMLANIVTDNKELPDSSKRDLIVSLITLKYTQSNSVCFAVDGQAIGVGAGQQSRVHCTRLAASKADTWILRQSDRVLDLPFISDLARPTRDNVIDGFINQTEEDVCADGNWQNYFTERPTRFTRAEQREYLNKASNIVLGSDAFFPFSDSIERAALSGVKYVAEPGGSIRDQEVIDCCNKYNMVMAFTGLRLFHH